MVLPENVCEGHMLGHRERFKGPQNYFMVREPGSSTCATSRSGQWRQTHAYVNLPSLLLGLSVPSFRAPPNPTVPLLHPCFLPWHEKPTVAAGRRSSSQELPMAHDHQLLSSWRQPWVSQGKALAFSPPPKFIINCLSYIVQNNLPRVGTSHSW